MRILNFNKWVKLNEMEQAIPLRDKVYTISSRPNYTYKISKNSKYWTYQKKSTTKWYYVENEESVNALNSKYNKRLAVYAKEGYEKYNISNRSNYHYKVDSSKKYWKYRKIGASDWEYVENKQSASSLNIKYGKSLKVYDKDSNRLPLLNKNDRANFNMAKIYIKRNSDKQTEVAKAIKKAGSSLGLNNNAIAALLGNVGRENNLRWSKITSIHSDPKNNAINFGIVSWQGDRRIELIKDLKKAGVYKDEKVVGGTYQTILEMIRFIGKEMKDSKFNSFKSATSTKTASDILYKYIVYSMGKYNKHDKYFHAWKNHMWAKAAKDLKLIDYSYS
jgi:hypothetical protein